MDEDEMFHALEEHHRMIVAGLDEIRRHCNADFPASTDLDSARSRLTKASRARSEFVSEIVVPALLRDADTDLRGALSDLLVCFTATRLLSNTHINKWTYASIEADWSGYRSAARDIWAMMEKQMERERRVLIEQLRTRSADKKRPA